MRPFSGFLAFVLVFFGTPLVVADEIALTATKDNTIFESSTGGLSNGSGQFLFAGRSGQGSGSVRRALLGFDLSSIPAEAVVTAVRLTMNMSKTAAGATMVSLHRVVVDWGEGSSNATDRGGGQGAAATNGDATWIHASFDSGTWSNPGGDFVTTASSSLEVGSTGSYTWPSTSQLVADLLGWIDSPATNFGWIVIGDESATRTAKRFDSREHDTTSRRPQLVVEFTVASGNNPPAAANSVAAQALTLGGNSVSFDLNTEPVVFTDADGDALSYTAASSDEAIATTALVGSVVTVAAVGEGSTTATLTATDADGGSATVEFGVVVGRLTGDFDGNGTVNFDDFFLFADSFGSTPASENWSVVFDLVGDDVINFDDFFVFADSFGSQAN